MDSHALYLSYSLPLHLCKQMSTFTRNSCSGHIIIILICVPINYNEKFATVLTHCANSNTWPFSQSQPKLQINKSDNKMKTLSQTMTPLALDGQTAALHSTHCSSTSYVCCSLSKVSLKLFWMNFLLFLRVAWLYRGTAWCSNDSSAGSTRQS